MEGMRREHPWIENEREYFGQKDHELYDFSRHDIEKLRNDYSALENVTQE